MRFLTDGPLRINAALAPAPSFEEEEGGGGGSARPAGTAAPPAPPAQAPMPAPPPPRAATRGRHAPRAEKAAASDAATPQGDPYLARLVKLIPSEVVALYLTFKEVAATWLGVWALICLFLVVLVRAATTRGSGQPIQFGAVAIASVSFVLWIYATGGTILGLQLPTTVPGLISVSVGVWTFIIPFIYKGGPAQPAAA